MGDMTYNDAALTRGMFSARWAALTKLDIDVATMRTWDSGLPRHKRILVPVDVQAMVVPTSSAEPTVPIAGTRGDPEPFQVPVARQPGVHLHWAMPDALLRGSHVDGATSITLPPLPDRWVVIRTMLPAGGRLAHVKGWVVDAAKGSVTPLEGFSGTTADAPDGVPTYAPLDGSSGGTLLWSATYEGGLNRFALHDDLADLPQLEVIAPNGFHGGRAVYTVAGWWADADADPLAVCRSRARLQDTVRSLGWHISPESPDDADEPEDPRIAALRSRSGLGRPATSVPMYQVDKYGITQTKFADASPAAAVPVERAAAHFVGIRPTHYHSLLHGSVLGVPIQGGLTASDDRPSIDDFATAVGLDLDDVTAALAAPGFGVGDGQRQSAERLMAAFTSDLLARIATPDGIRDIEEREHADGFWSFTGKPLPGAKDDRLRAEDSLPLGPTAVGRKGRGAAPPKPGRQRDLVEDPMAVRVRWKDQYVSVKGGASVGSAKPRISAKTSTQSAGATPGASRTVTKPGPRMYRPAAPVVAVRGLKPSARHHGDGLFDDEGLRCRWPGECVPGISGVVDAAAIVPTLGNGAIPYEVLTVVREAVVLDPYASVWLAQAGAPQPTWEVRVDRVKAEHLRLYGSAMIYDGSGTTALLRMLADGGQRAAGGSTWAQVSKQSVHDGIAVMQELARFSFISGATPSPVAVTLWRQPWVPLYVEWRVRATGRDTLDGWQLDGLDLMEGADGPPPADTVDRTLTGRSPISSGIGRSLGSAMTAWLDAENARDAATPSQSQLSEADEASLRSLRDLVAPLDLVSLSLDGIREQLLGIEYLGGAVVREAPAGQPGAAALPTASGPPTPLFGGELEILELRAVDAFGRVRTIPVAGMRTTKVLEVPDRPAAIVMAPRLQHGARWLFRLVDPGYDLAGDPANAPEAYVDQIAGEAAVTPISGYLLPDHMDESLECFDRFGHPIGELVHDTISEAVAWEPAPGRAVPPDAGPLNGIPGEFAAHTQHVAMLAAGLLRADIDTRHAGEPAIRSALSALLRAIDSTLWSIDSYQSIGSATIAGLVGKPVAVVRATLRLEVPDDLDEVLVTAVGGAEARRAVFDGLQGQRFPVRIGDLGRSDDAVLGFFVDDDYTRFHVVDKVVAARALQTGRHRGYLGLLGDTGPPAEDPITHKYLELEDTLLVRPGQVLRLTVLMLPAGKVHLTTGIVPRKALALADDWVTPGLQKLVPSLRVGPVLVDPAEIRLPKVASLGEDQNFIRRTGPLTWRDDPIVAANSAAMLPRVPHEAQEGWIRVAQTQPGSPSQDGTP